MNLTYEGRDTKYVYTKLELESMADKINAQFFPERLERALPLDPYLLLDKLGVEYEWEKISANGYITTAMPSRREYFTSGGNIK